MSELRASDADREQVAERLRAAAVEGRLTPTELEERMEQALAARTEAELAPLVDDLPPLTAELPVPPPRRRPLTAIRPAFVTRPDFGPYVAVSVMLVAIWALAGMGYFWPIWPILGWGISFWPMGRLGAPCHPGSSRRGYSTGKWHSSAAAGRGSAGPRR